MAFMKKLKIEKYFKYVLFQLKNSFQTYLETWVGATTHDNHAIINKAKKYSNNFLIYSLTNLLILYSLNIKLFRHYPYFRPNNR